VNFGNVASLGAPLKDGMAHWSPPVVCHLPGYGGAVVALPTLSTGLGNLVLFDASGTAVYNEVFSSALMGIAQLTEGGQDHLVVQLEDRILVYP
jgi:hypothetical protein